MRTVAGLLIVISVALPSVLSAHEGHHPIQIDASAAVRPTKIDPAKRRWLAGDHHVHSRYSVSYKMAATPGAPPTPVIAGDAPHPIPTNAAMGAKFGLAWMVSTDHGGPLHSKVNRDLAYPELLKARRAVPGVIQFYGMELNTPGAEHSSVIVPRNAAEREVLFGIESRYDHREPWPSDPTWNREENMVEALKYMAQIPAPPVVIANHPGRTARDLGQYTLVTPSELRNWNDAARMVAIGMEGAPGHQAGALNAKAMADPDDAFRGSYRRAPTMGGYDQMTARLGGFWDSMLGEGRRWWITSTSDSHRHYTEGGNDFWPGEYSKTYVKAVRQPADVLDGLRNGRVFTVLGDLVSEVDVIAQTVDGRHRAEIGGTLDVPRGSDVTVIIRLRDPAGANFGGKSSEVARVDLIQGAVSGPAADRTSDHNPTTRVERRFTARDWVRDGERLSMVHTIRNVAGPIYIRVRGSNGAELEPAADTAGEDPWSDLWFYANPVFVEVE
jgi:hypothetical protein